MPGPLWFVPISDIILSKVAVWYRDYEKGKVYATRDFLTEGGKFMKKPTIYEANVNFTKKEIEHFVDLVQSVIPKSPVTKRLIEIKTSVMNSKGILKPNTGYQIPFRFYKQDVQEILEALMAAKAGEKLTPIKDVVAEQLDKEQAPFEI